jgi:hypothetical protein
MSSGTVHPEPDEHHEFDYGGDDMFGLDDMMLREGVVDFRSSVSMPSKEELDDHPDVPTGPAESTESVYGKPLSEDEAARLMPAG